MPRATKSRSKAPRPDGATTEARLAQVWYWEGSFARFGIDLRRHFGEEQIQVTDLDLLAYPVGPGLRVSRVVGECKSGRDAKPLDRLVWLRGLADVVEADAAELTTAIAPPPKVRRLAENLGVVAQSIKDLETRETRLGIASLSNLGSHGTDMPEMLGRFREGCASDPELERAFWYFRSDAWLCDSYAAVKGSVSAIRLLAPKWANAVDDPCQRSLRFVLTEAVLQFIFGITGLARDGIRMNDADFAAVVHERFTYGDTPANAAKRTSTAVDKYVAGLLQAHGIPNDKIVAAMGAFDPTPPSYIEPLIEVVRRSVNDEAAARDALRYADLRLYERILRDRMPPFAAIDRLGLADERATSRLIRVYLSFLTGQAGLPEQYSEEALSTSKDVVSPQQPPVQPTLTGELS